MTWFYSVSHPIMTSHAPGRPPRPALKEILENEQVRHDHAIDVFPICQNTMWITLEGIKSGLFERGDDDAVALARSVLTEAQNA